MSDYELYHYGVLGMKWGVRRNPSKVYTRAYDKKTRLIERSSKYRLEAAKAGKKANRKLLITDRGRERQKRRSEKKELRSAKLERKAVKLERQMTKTFSDYEIKRVGSKRRTMGRRFIEQYELTPFADVG